MVKIQDVWHLDLGTSPSVMVKIQDVWHLDLGTSPSVMVKIQDVWHFTLRLFAFKIALKSYVEAPHRLCVNFFLACGRECLAVGKKSLRGFRGKITSDSGPIVRLLSDAMYRV